MQFMQARRLLYPVAATAMLIAVGGSAASLRALPAQLAFTVGTPSSSPRPESDTPYLVGRGGHVRKLLSAPGDSFALAWSPDGSRLASVDRRNASLVILRPGYQAFRLPLAGGVDFHVAWTPDGRGLLYQRGRTIFVADAKGRGERALAHNALTA